MSGQDSSSGRLPSDYSSELNRAVPALVRSGGSVHTYITPMTSSSSEPAHATSPEVPNPVRFPGGADAELRRRLADHDRDGIREHSRDQRVRTQHHSISTPVQSRPTTPRHHSPRSIPVAPPSQDDRVSDLQGQAMELQRRLRQAETYAHEHGQWVEQQAAASMIAVVHQEETMRQQSGWLRWPQPQLVGCR